MTMRYPPYDVTEKILRDFQEISEEEYRIYRILKGVHVDRDIS